ncbi:integrase core domain protein [Mycobacteroides abscessus subsp. bolletii 103]|nr:integrase core domain protein [Mycobacteroides abscessus subsp. bolletii 103]
MICEFIDEHKNRFGVVPICRALGIQGVAIAPRTYWAHRSSAPSKRALWDTTITEILAGVYEPDEHGKRPPECLYGSLKMWAHLQRQGIPVARCTVERIMRTHGWRGATRARTIRTTERDPAAARAPDLVRRRFHASRPNLLVVADFTYVPLDGGGFGYTAFVIDAYAGLIAGWECSLTKNTAFVERAIRQATAYRARQGHRFTGDTIHHSDAGSQYTATHFTETLMLAGLVPSIGTVGDALDNALAETTIGLYKTECVREAPRSAPDRSAPWPTWRTSPRRGCTGMTPPGSCTALAAARQPKPRPSTTPGCTPVTPSAVRRLGSRRVVSPNTDGRLGTCGGVVDRGQPRRRIPAAVAAEGPARRR